MQTETAVQESKPFDIQDGDTVEVTVASWHKHQQHGQGFSANTCSYGIAVTVNGEFAGGLWGAGYATHAVPPQVFAMQRAIRLFHGVKRLEIHTLEEVARYVGPRADAEHSRKRDALGLAIAEVKAALKDNKSIRYTTGPKWVGTWFQKASILAGGVARAAAVKHQQDNEATTADYPHPCIVLEGEMYGHLPQ